MDDARTMRDGADPGEVAALMQRVLYEVKKVVVGQDHFLERVLVAVLARGHLLVEGVPGLAKTLTVKTLARALQGDFKRIQFTPDLVPADLVGTRIWRPSTEDFDIEWGPVFANLVLADEINRAPAKVQSALLEAMAERQVSIGGQTYIVSATLVQPDFGKVLPKGPRAPIVIAAKPIDAGMLKSFSRRYLLDNLLLLGPTAQPAGRSVIELRDMDGAVVATLSWVPRQPGTYLLQKLQWPLLGGIAVLAILALLVIRRGRAIVNELIASETRSRHLAYHDQLTQLPNRALLFETLRALLAARFGDGNRLAVICVDFDRFKDVNDTLGHHAGDELIQTVAGRLRESCGDAELIARLGGDEFVVLLEFAEEEQVHDLCRRILAAVSERIDSEFGWLEVGCSLGVAVIDHAGVEPTEALRWADVAMYRSKEGGRQRVTFFEPEMDDALSARRLLEADLRSALGDGSLGMVYQPQVDRTGRVTAAEALLRWNHPVRGAIPPGIFVPLAEETGLIMALGEFVLRQVFSETAQWVGLRVGINVSAVQIRSHGFAALVTRLAAQAGADPSRYEIELTETALLGDDPITAANVEALKRLGFSIALDDFGTGYTSLAVLQRYSVNRIKIDRSFVCALDESGEGEALVDAMVKLARSLNLGVIAEGVETEAQRKRLMACGCREFQGYLTGMPQRAE